jgi:hypothetical protein
MQITLADIEAARERIAGGVYLSPCVPSIPLSNLTGADIWCKLDYLQRTGVSGARRAQRAPAPHPRAAQTGCHCRFRRQPRAGLPTTDGCSIPVAVDAEIRRARQSHEHRQFGAGSSCTART